MHKGLPYFRGEAKLSTWIYRIVINVLSQERPELATVSLDDARTKTTARAFNRRRTIAPLATW